MNDGEVRELVRGSVGMGMRIMAEAMTRSGVVGDTFSSVLDDVGCYKVSDEVVEEILKNWRPG